MESCVVYTPSMKNECALYGIKNQRYVIGKGLFRKIYSDIIRYMFDTFVKAKSKH